METGMPSKLISISLIPNTGGDHDRAARARLISPQGHLDLGSLLRQLDWETGMFVNSHLPHGTGPVTVNIEGSHVHERLGLDKNYVVNMVFVRSGGSSLEVQADVLAQSPSGAMSYVTSVYYAFVTINEQGKPVKHAPECAPQSVQEKILQDESLERKAASIFGRDLQRVTSTRILELGPGMTGKIASHELVRIIPATAQYCNNNIHGIIFGGQILKDMFDYAQSCARETLSALAEEQLPLPLVAAINNVTFDTPVRPGDNIIYDVSPVYSSQHSLVNTVTLARHNPEDEGTVQSNSALFTFVPVTKNGEKLTLSRAVVPSRECDILAHNTASQKHAGYRQDKNRPNLHESTLRLLDT